MNSLARRLVREARIDLWAATLGVLVNTVLGSNVVPRPLRWLGYKAFGTRIDTPNIFPGAKLLGPMRHIRIAAGTFANRELYLEAVAPIEIGRDCQLGPQVMIVTSHHDRTPTGVSKVPRGRPVKIGDRAWIGARAMILPGVTVGDDVVIGAGSVVTRDCLEPGVYVGSPARKVGP
jgi:maltose O-acetyltransferase